MSGNDLFDASWPERADQLVLEVGRADVRRVAEHAAEVPLLVGVAEADDALAVVPFRGPPDRLRAADRDDLDSGRDEVQVETSPRPPRARSGR